jgi:proteasome assembly chaperone 3
MSDFIDNSSNTLENHGNTFATDSLLQGIAETSSLPPFEKKVTIELNGIPTEILCTSFVDRIVIFISQMNKVGTLISAWSEQKNDGGKIYQTSILLGKRDDPLLTIYARQLIEKITAHCNKTLLLGISLKEEGRSREQFQFIINSVLENLIL